MDFTNMDFTKVRWVVGSVLVAGLIGFFAGQGFTDEGQPSEEEMMKAMLELSKPGPSHEGMKSLAGNFDVESKMYASGPEPIVSKGSCSSKWVLGGRYLESHFKGNFHDIPYEGHGVLAFDNFKKEYQNVWYDTFSSNILWGMGSASDDGKTITISGVWEGPMGKMDTRHVYTIESDDRYILTGWMTMGEQGEKKTMEMTFTRRKGPAVVAGGAAAKPGCCPPGSKGPGY